MGLFGGNKFNGSIGNYKSCCGGLCLISHVKGDYIYATLAGILLPVLLFGIFEGSNLLMISPILSILFYLLPLLAFIFAIITWCVEPGIIPHGEDSKESEDMLLSHDERLLNTIMMSISNGKIGDLDKSLNVYPQLLKQKNKEGRTLLHITALYGNLNNVKSLLRYPIDVNAKDIYGLTPLHYAFFEKKDDIAIYLYNYIYNRNLIDDDENKDKDPFIEDSTSSTKTSEASSSPEPSTIQSNFIPDGELTLSNQYYILQRNCIREVYDHMGNDLAEDPRYMYPLSVSSGSKHMRSFIVNGHIESLRYCSFCHIYIPPRAFHCRQCNTCILKFDHHCPWMSTCIGLRNKKFFIYMLIFSCLSLILDILVSIFFVYYYIIQPIDWTSPDYDLLLHNIFTHLYIILFIIFAVIFVYPVCRLTIYNFTLICYDKTTNEYLIKTVKKHSPFSHGILHNIAHELCSITPPSLVTYNEFYSA